MLQFDKDVFCKEFNSRVVSCEKMGEFYKIVLDDTIFYPEGGGQPCDTGFLNDISVENVQRCGETVVHFTKEALTCGAEVTGRIDWSRRFDLMQQHSGEHIVSGFAHSMFGCDNVGFHMGKDVITIDFNVELSANQVEELEGAVNEYIWENHGVEITYPDENALKSMDYRSKKELSGEVRIVGFPEGDCCACCGTHVEMSGQVGFVTILSCQKFRDGVRLELLCGGRALRYMNQLKKENGKISQLLSAKVLETSGAVERLLAEKEAVDLEKWDYQQKYVELFGKNYKNHQNALVFLEEVSVEELRLLAVAISHEVSGVALCFASVEGGFRFAISSQCEDVRGIVSSLKEKFQGRGGGKANLVQGTIVASEVHLRGFLNEEISFCVKDG